MHFELSERDYHNFRDLIYQRSGITLHQGKKELLKARLSKYLRGSRFRSLQEYYRYLIDKDDGDECVHLLDSVSTNLTYFFREPKHFAFLRNTAVPNLLGLPRVLQEKRICIWSAGCSSGEEAFSIAISLVEHLGKTHPLDIRILGTDLSTKVLEKARRAIFPQEKLRNISQEVKRRYFQMGVKNWGGYYRLKPFVRKMIRFERLNLIDPFPSGLSFNIIFCRNVMIYFDKSIQEQIINKFYRILAPKGYLFIGHAESLAGTRHPFKYIQPSIYQK